MKISDLKPTLFTELKKVFPDLKIFTYFDPAQMDAYYNLRYGFRTVAPMFEKTSSAEMATYLGCLFGKKWDGLLDYYLSSLTTLSKGGNSISETVNTTTDGTNQNTNSDNVSAYNNDDFSPDSQTVSDGKNHSEIIKKREYLNTRVSDMDFQAKIDYLKNTSVYDTIFMDTNSVCTLSVHSIFEDCEV